MSFKNKPAVNEPDLLRPSPDVVNQATVLLALRKHYQKGLSQGLTTGFVLGLSVLSIWHLFDRLISGHWHWGWFS
ncbi:hypothetical protein QNM99_17245 [Pseudomonas sp. PCH446]